MRDDTILHELDALMGCPLRECRNPTEQTQGASERPSVAGMPAQLTAAGWAVTMSLQDGFWSLTVTRDCDGWAVTATGTAPTLTGALWEVWLGLDDTFRSRCANSMTRAI